MRFTNLLTLLAATSAFALKFKRDDQLGKLQGLNIPVIPSKECAEVSKAIVTCFGDGTNDNQTDEEACKRFNSKECQSVVDQDYSVCADVGALYDATIDLSKVVCATDEKGNFCPHSKKIQKSPNASYTDSDIQEICKSKVCYEKALDAFTRMKKSTSNMGNLVDKSDIDDSIDELDGYINALNEDKCKAAAGVNVGGGTAANTNAGATGINADMNVGTPGATDTAGTNIDDKNDSSDAVHVIVESALLASLALALYFF